MNQDLSVDKLAANPSFKRWVMDEDGVEGRHWKQWLSENPDKVALVKEAKALIYAVHYGKSELCESEVAEEANRILNRVVLEGNEPVLLKAQTTFSLYRVLSAAAMIFMVLAASIYFYKQYQTKYSSPINIAFNTDDFQQYSNPTSHITLIYLPDRSIVSLKPGSRIALPRKFSSGKREVFLDGEAFFEVQKNPSRPFLVYTDKLVTKVLGTSFTVSSKGENAGVIVKTGKVSVFKKENFNDGDKVKLSSGLLLTANQAVIITPKHELNKQIVARPDFVKGQETANFNFESTPIPIVFKRLQIAYGIRIVYDDELLVKCSFSASMGKECFYDKLNLICRAINATYESIDGVILITAPGCNN